MSQESTSLAIQDDQMATVSKDFFFDGMMLPVPVFLRMKPGYYVMIGKKSEKANFSQFHSYKNPQTSVFVKSGDHSTLIHYITELTGRVIGQKTVPDAVKGKFLTGLTENALESFDGKGFGNIQQLQKVSNFIMNLGDSIGAFDEILQLLAELPNDESKHAIATTMIALALCEEMQVNLRAAQEKVALGCLLHDVGLKFVPGGLMEKPRHLWTPEDNAAFEMHPIKGVEMLRDLKDVSNDVLLIVSEHHENAIGTGFPKKMRDVKISPLGRIVGLANAYASLLFARSELGRNYVADEAINYLDVILGQPYNKQAFSALKNIVNKRYLQDKAKA